MPVDESTVSVDQVAKLHAQILSLKQKNTDLVTRNSQLVEDLEHARSELRETLASLGEAFMKANRLESQLFSIIQNGSSSSGYTAPALSSSSLKRPSSPTSQSTGPSLPPSKKGKGQAPSGESAVEAGSSRSAGSSAAPCTPIIWKVKESPRKPVKLEFTSGVEVILVDDDSDMPLARPIPQKVVKNSARKPNHPADADSDLEDPNVSIESSFQDDIDLTPGGEGTVLTMEAVQSNEELTRQTSEPLRRSARFSSRSSRTSVSASVTPVATTPDMDDDPDLARNPKLEPKLEPKHEAKQEDFFRLPSDVAAMYLHSATSFVINPPPMTLEIPRTFLRLAYGGSDQHFVQYMPAAPPNPGPPFTINADGVKVPKDKRRAVFPMLNANPSMPSTPGAPGLLFASRHEILYNPPWSLFCKRSNSKTAVWLYLGEYESELVGKLTPEQFKAQTVVVQNDWADRIITQQRQVCYMSMRARIVLRAAGSISNDSKEREQELVNKEVERIKRGNGRKITVRQVLEAFSNGDEGVDIIRMKCTKYDHVFANDITKRFKDYPKMKQKVK